MNDSHRKETDRGGPLFGTLFCARSNRVLTVIFSPAQTRLQSSRENCRQAHPRNHFSFRQPGQSNGPRQTSG